jgi:uncharacterized membrane protein
MNLRGFGADASGNIAILFAVAFAVAAVLAAVAVDAASLYHERRMVQNGVDMAALSAASDTGKAASIAQSSLIEAGLLAPASTEGLTVTTGHYNPDPNVPVDERFKPGQPPLNAVHVHFERQGQLHFARGWAPSPTIGASAIATVTPEVSFSLGSRLASLNGGIANSLLNALLGTNLSLSVMDYNGLLNAQVDVLQFLDAVAIKLNLTAGTYNDLLATQVDGGIVASVLETLLNGVARTAVSKLASSVGNGGTVDLGKLLQLGPLADLEIGTAGGQNLFTTVSVLDLLAASVGLGAGPNQVSLALATGLPGLLSLDASLAIGEPPQGGGWYAVGPTGTVVRTAQTRLKLVADVLGSGALLGIPIRLPLYVELGHSEAIVGAASCPTGTNASGSATILTRPGAARVILGEISDATFGAFNTTPVVSRAKLVEVTLLGATILAVEASSIIEIAQSTPVPLSFSSAEIAARTVKTAATKTPISSLTNSLLSNLQLHVPILGLGLNLTGLTLLLKAIISPLAPILDLVVNQLTRAIGVGLGEADVRVYGVRCTHPVLVG